MLRFLRRQLSDRFLVDIKEVLLFPAMKPIETGSNAAPSGKQ